jgi:hypothetical protein
MDAHSAVEGMMNYKLCAALLASAIAFGAPALASAQEEPGTAATDSVATTRLDRETYALASLRQQIPQGTIAIVPIAGLGRDQRRMLIRELTPQREAALQNAISAATVATEDRPNGISEDQVTLAEYLTELGIDPAHVVAVTIATNVDRENPPVTVYYRGRIFGS